MPLIRAPPLSSVCWCSVGAAAGPVRADPTAGVRRRSCGSYVPAARFRARMYGRMMSALAWSTEHRLCSPLQAYIYIYIVLFSMGTYRNRYCILHRSTVSPQARQRHLSARCSGPGETEIGVLTGSL